MFRANAENIINIFHEADRRCGQRRAAAAMNSPSETRQEIKFMDGEPMIAATNWFAGRS